MTRYFKNIDCVEELKRQYRILAKKYHSDITHGDDTAMKQLNVEYAELHKKYKDIHGKAHADTNTNTQDNQTQDTQTQDTRDTNTQDINEVKTSEELKKIIRILSPLKGLKFEICGSWLWISGDTKIHRDALKDIGCRWASKKAMWYWRAPEHATMYHGKSKDMSEIRDKYGSQNVRVNYRAQLA